MIPRRDAGEAEVTGLGATPLPFCGFCGSAVLFLSLPISCAAPAS